MVETFTGRGMAPSQAEEMVDDMLSRDYTREEDERRARAAQAQQHAQLAQASPALPGMGMKVVRKPKAG